MEQNKTCKKCDINKPISQFYKQKSGKYGVMGQCKECINKQRVKYYWNNRDKELQNDREYYKNNKEYFRNYDKEYRKNNKEIMKQRSKNWHINNRYRSWAVRSLAQHKIKNIVINISSKELENIAINIKKCPICDINIDWNAKLISNSFSPTLDRLDNSNEININNIQIICHKCNSTKRNRTMEEFIEYCKMVAKKFGD